MFRICSFPSPSPSNNDSRHTANFTTYRPNFIIQNNIFLSAASYFSVGRTIREFCLSPPFFPFLWISFNFSLSLSPSLPASLWKITRKFRVDSQDQSRRTSEQKRSGLRVAHYSMKRETPGLWMCFELQVGWWSQSPCTEQRAARPQFPCHWHYSRRRL